MRELSSLRICLNALGIKTTIKQVHLLYELIHVCSERLVKNPQIEYLPPHELEEILNIIHLTKNN